MESKINKVTYLSGAPRVSTKNNIELTGPRSHVLGIINGFEDCGYIVDQFIFGNEVPNSWVQKGSEEKVTKSWLSRVAADIVRLFMGFINSRRALWRTGRSDLVYERLASFQALGASYARKGIPWILETNAILYKEASKDRNAIAFPGLAKKLEHRAYRKADMIICVTDSLKNMIEDEFDINPKKIVVVPNGVDLDRFNPDRYQSEKIANHTLTVGFVGSVVPWQSLDLLLRTVGKMTEEKFDIGLVIVGSGPELESLKKYSRRLGIQDRVYFIGRVAPDDVPAYLKGFDICYSGQVPLESGNMYLSPLKLYEYMAMAKPVVASDFGDARYLVGQSGAGYLFQPGNEEELLDQLTAAYHNNKLKEMGLNGRIEIEKNHSWNARVKKILESASEIL